MFQALEFIKPIIPGITITLTKINSVTRWINMQKTQFQKEIRLQKNN